MSNLLRVIPIFILFLGLTTSWSIFPLSRSSFENFAKQKISSLKNLRGILNIQNSESEATTPKPTPAAPIQNAKSTLPETLALVSPPTTTVDITYNIDIEDATPTTPPSLTTENFTNSLYKKEIDQLEQLTLQSGNITSKNNVEHIIDQLAITTQDINKKLVEMRETIEPKVKKFLTEKYNSLLSNLVPYSETIGVPTYVLNSLKIPQNFDPRLQQIVSRIKSFSLGKKNGDKGENEKIQSRMDDQDLVSDQEPDATSKGQKKYVYLAARSRPKAYAIPDKNGYEIAFDSVSAPLDQETLESSLYSKGYYLEDYPYASVSDVYEAAASNQGRRHHGNSRGGGHGHGGGHGGGGGYGNGLMDPFTILGGLAFLTYLGLLIQQSLNRTAGTGRGFGDDEWEMEFEKQSRRIPVMLTKLKFDDNFEKSSHVTEEQRTNSHHKMQPQSDSHLDNELKNCTHFCQILKRLRRLKQLNQEQQKMKNPTKIKLPEKNRQGAKKYQSAIKSQYEK